MTVGVAALVELQAHSVPPPSLMTAGLNFLLKKKKIGGEGGRILVS